ncbi:GlcNAc-PI de-N-acetylase [Actinosynnema sp. ALI-1.44]|uniref:PIG-L family deacetylase n=1 Tax=Actinosynnema sp. ALI-1.44 TaxID=1933779 RepID=UPI00097BFC39|nr:PIG-L family deacetylase [Actinosynnema sp. ALI-1.44]ONI87923.1 GlcNAc-PI de-N-acetylase [Actinosynnema sp. ALI-1.44]
MATLVSLHAHPDDESIGTGGVLRKASEEGHRVVLVVATNGEHGELVDGVVLADGESLATRRIKETYEAAEILGVHRVVFLGYQDSGMMGADTNDDARSFWQADVDKAARALADLLTEEHADVLTVYDDNGGYGHPDHIQVHRVGMRAAEIAGTRKVYQQTMNRDRMRRGRKAFAARAKAAGIEIPGGGEEDHGTFGKPEAELTAAVDVTPYLAHKRRAMRAHASQIGEKSVFLAMPDEGFRFGFGTEWFIRAGQGPGITETDLFQGLA